LGGNLTIEGSLNVDGELQNQGTIEIARGAVLQELRVAAQPIQNAGRLKLGGLIEGNVQNDAGLGVLEVTTRLATIDGNLKNEWRVELPIVSSTLVVRNSYEQTAGGSLITRVDLQNRSTVESGMTVFGSAKLAGSL
jgi:hypothetical protein